MSLCVLGMAEEFKTGRDRCERPLSADWYAIVLSIQGVHGSYLLVERATVNEVGSNNSSMVQGPGYGKLEFLQWSRPRPRTISQLRAVGAAAKWISWAMRRRMQCWASKPASKRVHRDKVSQLCSITRHVFFLKKMCRFWATRVMDAGKQLTNSFFLFL